MKRRILNIAALAILLGGTATLNSCQYDDTKIWDEIESLKTQDVKELNESLLNLQNLIAALDNGAVAVSVTKTAGGCVVIFSDNTAVNVIFGEDASVVSVIEQDGQYYWAAMRGGEMTAVLDNSGSAIPATSTPPTIGINNEGYWTINSEIATASDNAGIKAESGSAIFKKVSETTSSVSFTLTDGVVIEAQKIAGFGFEIQGLDLSEVLVLCYGETVQYDVVATGLSDFTINRPYGWAVSLEHSKLTITAPAYETITADKSGEIALTLVSETGKSSIVKFDVLTYEVRTLTFEDKDYKGAGNYLGNNDWSSLIDSKQNGGTLLYGEDGYGTGGEYRWTDDNNTYLHSEIPVAYGSAAFWNGGQAISNYALLDIQTASYDTQLSVPFIDALTGKSGYNGSDNFCVHFGYAGDMMLNAPSFDFADGRARVVAGMYVMATSLLAKFVDDMDGMGTPMAEDQYVNIVAMGYNGEEKTGEVVLEIASGADGFIGEWTPWDLSSLGEVTKIEFDIQGNVYNDNGFSAPAYFAYDNVSVIF